MRCKDKYGIDYPNTLVALKVIRKTWKVLAKDLDCDPTRFPAWTSGISIPRYEVQDKIVEIARRELSGEQLYRFGFGGGV